MDKKEPGGLRFDAGKAPVALIPPKADEAEAMVWAAGAEKYGMWNWKKGMTIMRILSCIGRHVNKIKAGEDYDSESGQPHAAHIRCNAAMLIEFLGREDLDDRAPAAEPPEPAKAVTELNSEELAEYLEREGRSG